MKTEKCYKNQEPFKQCCCQCVNHKKVMNHPWYSKKPITTIYGYVCTLPEMREFTISVEHSMGCEMHELKS